MYNSIIVSLGEGLDFSSCNITFMYKNLKNARSEGSVFQERLPCLSPWAPVLQQSNQKDSFLTPILPTFNCSFREREPNSIKIRYLGCLLLLLDSLDSAWRTRLPPRTHHCSQLLPHKLTSNWKRINLINYLAWNELKRTNQVFLLVDS